MIESPRGLSDHSKHDHNTHLLPVKRLGWAAKLSLGVLLYAAVVPSPVECLGWAAESLLDVLLCAVTAPSPVECLGWVVEPLVDALLCAVTAPSPESAEPAHKRTRWISDHSKHGLDTCSLPVECLAWAVEPLLDVVLYAAIAPAPWGCRGMMDSARERTRCLSEHSKHDHDTPFLPVKCLGWAAELSLDVLSCAAVVPSPEGRDESQSQPARTRTMHFSDHPKHDYDTHSYQSNVWVGLSSYCSTSYRVPIRGPDPSGSPSWPVAYSPHGVPVFGYVSASLKPG